MKNEGKLIAAVYEAAEIHPAGSGHFVYTSGTHGDGYVDYRPLGKKPEYLTLLQEASVLLLQKTVHEARFDTSRSITVIGPETMGAQMVDAIQTADQCGKLENLRLHTRKLMKNPIDQTKFIWSADPEKPLKSGQTIVMDDLLNQSKTFRQIEQMVLAAGGSISALAVFGERCNVTATDLGIESITSFHTFPGFTVHSPETCSMCLAKVPIIRHPGHGYKFEKKHPDYAGGFIDKPAT